MPTPEQIREGIRKMAGEHGPPVTNIAEVKSVDEQAHTCVLIDEDGQEFFNVRLRPVLTGNASFIMIPKVGTKILAVRIEDDEDWMVIACDEFTSVSWTIGDLKFVLDNQATITKGETQIELGENIIIKRGQTKVTVGEKLKLEAGGQNMAALIDLLFDAITAMVFVTPNGNTTALVNTAQFTVLKQQFNQLLN